MNIQGLTNEKYTEVYGLLEDRTVVCLTETQKKVDNIRVGQQVEVISSMRKMEEKKGGGIMVLYEENSGMFLEKTEEEYADCMVMEGRMGKEEINLVIVYLGTGGERVVLQRNREMLQYIKRKVEDADGRREMILVVGDFNGHLGYIGYQQENEIGKEINRFIEETGLLLMNIDEKCNGVYTWERGESKSVIDLVMVNEMAYGKVKKVEIDSNRDVIDVSDHCLIEVVIDMERDGGKKNVGWKEVTYYCTKEEKMRRYVERMEEEVEREEAGSMRYINEAIRRVADEVLKTRCRRRVDDEGREEPPWMCSEIRREIAKRRRLNKAHRNGEEEERREAWRAYREQKEKVKKMISEERRKYENRIAEEIRDMQEGRDLWKMVRKLKGEKVNGNRKLKLYTEEGDELEEEKYEEEIKQFWEGIYKMHENRMEDVWNEETKEEYERTLRRTREREANPEEMWLPRLANPYWNVKVMEMVIEREDVRKALGGLKNRKAGGCDGLKPEMYKVLQGSDICVEALRRGLEGVIWEGGEPEEWKESKTVMIPKTRRPKVSELRPIPTNI